MKVGDLVIISEDLRKSMKDVGVFLEEYGIIVVADDGFYQVRSGDVDDIWLTLPDIKKIPLDKYKI